MKCFYFIVYYWHFVNIISLNWAVFILNNNDNTLATKQNVKNSQISSSPGIISQPLTAGAELSLFN